MNAKLSETEYELRDIVIKALAGNTDPCNARGVLSQALEQLKVDAWAAAQAYEAGAANMANFQALLLNLATKAEALENFCDRYLDVNFTTSAERES